ncbi:tetratricopeptide repeat-containing sensor histidine kinase [Carboxylicivirga sp. N1Y90]|uniref:tetratricopeptide repeat-containing sensor histidine kinase n=1 Tax=Carboxylicivirga fragile TaxID=3417571 RepID=UPI003D33AA92|nr:tetratricopeptide repeat-containing sensor histidine kinase [Marinilabiliaceae bacterium N1Y90]
MKLKGSLLYLWAFLFFLINNIDAVEKKHLAAPTSSKKNAIFKTAKHHTQSHLKEVNKDSIPILLRSGVRNSSDSISKCVFLIELGKHLYKIKKYSNSLDTLKLALKLNKSIDCSIGEADSYFYIGKVYSKLKNTTLQVTNIKQSILIYKTLGEVNKIILANLELASHFSKRENNEYANIYFNEINEWLYHTSNLHIQKTVLLHLGNHYIKNGKSKEAIENYYKLELLATSNNDYRILSMVYNNLGVLYLKEDNLEKAKKYLIKSVELKTKHKYNNLETCYLNLYKISSIKNETNEANQYFKILSSMLKDSTLKSIDILDFYYNSVFYFSLIKQPKKSQFYLKEYIELKDSLSNLAFSDKLIEMEKSFEIQERDKEISLLQKEDELKEAKLHNQLLAIISIASTLLILLVLGYFINRQRYRLKKSEKHLHLQKKEISDINEALKLSNLSKDKLLSVIGHDLRGPVGGLKELIELYMDLPNYEPNDIENLLKAARESSTSTYHLLENLLSWANSQRGEIDYNPVATPLLPLVKQTVGILDSSINTRKIAFEYQIDPQIVVDSDINMLRTIIRNLVSNAVKYSPPESSIIISANLNSKETLICISDKGYGMSADETQQLFEKKETYFIESGPNAKGSGLGLILCKEFVERHDGRIWVESEKDKGTKVCFTLPNSKAISHSAIVATEQSEALS